MAWQIQTSEPVRQWRNSLDPVSAERFEAKLAQLAERGPRLGRPSADTIKGSRFPNMKELRVGTMRALYAFDSRRSAVLLVAGDKRNDWQAWYQRNVPVADRLFDAHQRGIGGGVQRWQASRTGARSEARGR